MIVVDASAVLELLLRTRKGLEFEARALVSGQPLHAPHLIDLEVAQVLRRYVLAGQIESLRAERSLDVLAGLPIQRHPHLPFVDRIWQLRHNVTAYDAAYIALAESMNLPLLTADAALARTRGHSAQVDLLASG